MNSKLFLNGGKRPPLLGPNETHDASLPAVRIMLSHFLLDGPRRPGTWFALDDAQKAVYAATNTAPIFTGPNRDVVNMEWILHCMNFFKFYMTSPDEKLFDLLEDDFGPSKRPTPWSEPLKSGTYPLTTRWYGTYSFMDHHPLALFRARTTMPRCGPHIFDHNVGEGKVQVRSPLHISYLKSPFSHTTVPNPRLQPPGLPPMAPLLRAPPPLPPCHRARLCVPRHPLRRQRQRHRRSVLRNRLAECSPASVRHPRLAAHQLHEAL